MWCRILSAVTEPFGYERSTAMAFFHKRMTVLGRRVSSTFLQYSRVHVERCHTILLPEQFDWQLQEMADNHAWIMNAYFFQNQESSNWNTCCCSLMMLYKIHKNNAMYKYIYSWQICRQLRVTSISWLELMEHTGTTTGSSFIRHTAPIFGHYFWTQSPKRPSKPHNVHISSCREF